MDTNPFDDPEPVELPINGELDLHTFQPKEIKELVPDYLQACREKGILTVRIVHGKGIGNLRRTVHSILSKNPNVISFALAGEQFGGWGATMVSLHPLNKKETGNSPE
jgi:DNA-nicking Smr family endonuclease